MNNIELDAEKSTYKDMISEIYDKSDIPVVYLNPDLSYMYSNESAKLCYRMFCVFDGVINYINNEGAQFVINSLKNKDIVKYDLEDNAAFSSLIFTNIYNRKGELQAVQLKAEESSPIYVAISKFFPNIPIVEIFNNEFLLPATNSRMAVDFLKRKYNNDSTLLKYLDLISENTCKEMLAVHKFTDLIDLRIDTVGIEGHAVNPIPIIEHMCDSFEIEYDICTSAYKDPVVLGSEEIILKVFTNALLFFTSLDYINKIRNSIRIIVDSDEANLIFNLRAYRVKKPIGKDVFSPSFSDDGQMNMNLYTVQHIVENIGGKIKTEYRRDGSYYYSVLIYLPRILKTETVLSDSFDSEYVNSRIDRLLSTKFLAIKYAINEKLNG